MKKASIILSVWLGLIALTAQVWGQQDNEVNLYSARIEALIKPLLDQFSEETGITVNLITGNADELLQRLQSEGQNTPADMLLTTDAGRLYRAKKAGVIQAVNSKTLSQRIPKAYRDPEGYWYGLSLRARPIMYVKGKVDPAELSTYEDHVICTSALTRLVFPAPDGAETINKLPDILAPCRLRGFIAETIV